MRRLSADDIDLRPLGAQTDDETPRCEVMVHGESAGTELRGARLEAAVATDDNRYLLFVTDDVPYEEFLSIYLLGPDHRLRDSATIGAMYATGQLEDVELAPPDGVTFRFGRDAPWRVRLLSHPKLRPSIGVGAGGLRRPASLMREMEVG